MTKYAETFDFRWKTVYNGIKLSVLEGIASERVKRNQLFRVDGDWIEKL